jgi:4-hydroxythreonine-4-phosphate dehydrogenase
MPGTMPPLAVTMGDPAGIGGDTLLQAWLRRSTTGRSLPAFFAIDDPSRLTALAALLHLDVPIATVSSPEEAKAAFNDSLPVLPIGPAVTATPGKLEKRNNDAVLDSIRKAVELAAQGLAAAVVTNPIHKGILLQSGFSHAGHTDYLAELCQSTTPPVMMLACPGLRVVPVTVHCALKTAIETLTTALIVETGRTTVAALKRDFAVPKPALAVAGLNPHAGEGGEIGTEDEEIVRPAVQALRKQGIDAFGPEPSDSLFHAAARKRYDACLCMYHDQALIPLKTIDFANGVNITLGLNIVRTSPDHGTALPIAGTGKADPSSLIAAIETAARIAEHRSIPAP